MKPQEEVIIDLEPGKSILVKLLSVGTPDKEGIRIVFFSVNGENRFVRIKDKSIESYKEEHIKEMVEYHKLHDVEWDIENGKPAKVIRERAEKTNCDLIIIGSHGEKGLRAILGSTATGVLHDAPCDVLCVRLFTE